MKTVSKTDRRNPRWLQRCVRWLRWKLGIDTRITTTDEQYWQVRQFDRRGNSTLIENGVITKKDEAPEGTRLNAVRKLGGVNINCYIEK